MSSDQIVLAVWTTPGPFFCPETMSPADLIPPTQNSLPSKAKRCIQAIHGQWTLPHASSQAAPVGRLNECPWLQPVLSQESWRAGGWLQSCSLFLISHSQTLVPWLSLLITLVTLSDAASDFCLSFLPGNVIRIFVTEELHEYST